MEGKRNIQILICVKYKYKYDRTDIKKSKQPCTKPNSGVNIEEEMC